MRTIGRWRLRKNVWIRRCGKARVAASSITRKQRGVGPPFRPNAAVQTAGRVVLILISSADRVRFVMAPRANPAYIPCGCSARPISLPAVPARAEPPGRRRGPPRAEAPGYAPNPYAAPPIHALPTGRSAGNVHALPTTPRQPRRPARRGSSATGMTGQENRVLPPRAMSPARPMPRSKRQAEGIGRASPMLR